ncbi:hypothetical protein AAG906_014494 [Vitis piasezkii]|uniref:Uncharacterized protein n=1 Tax=Vitis vinifera TaxID=29760 RepID=A5AI93_VITVI|nr:uncharacterized protein LOC100243200 [Vitis vinifera]XP_034694276.1 uncharacterized protein LOC117920769 [Vitis riparia]CAN66779.1 hypothetical protein VITISV_039550 [Vitis vinifera]|eukprot:XP_002277319.1 PREDICTED: uncharacterized protein LOC100243200 [Vitis vinifera]
MSSVCISSCVNDARVPVRATYVNLYKWPESDAEFIKSVSSNRHPRVVDSISCRQMYLRSYTFSKKETVPEKTIKCFGRVKERVAHGRRRNKGEELHGKRFVVVRKVKEISCSALYAIFRRLLYCTTTVDVVDSRDQKCESL